jgi:AcrR family transcriptional regulator
VSQDEALLGLRPPQQARSRAVLQKVLVAAEEVLGGAGPDDFTIAAVAERAGVSIGALYRRFTGREQLLNAVKDRLLSRLEGDVAAALDAAEPSLAGVVEAYIGAMVGGFSAGTHLYPYLADGEPGSESYERGSRALATMQRCFLDAAAPHVAEVRRSDPMTALVTVSRTLAGATIHRTLTFRQSPDGISWARWAEEVADMAVLYLTTVAGPPR